jgi:hypothetical protein
LVLGLSVLTALSLAVSPYRPLLETRAGAAGPSQDVDGGERVRAPELEGGVDWLNSAGPIRLQDLRGKIVVLDFWTLC